MNLDKQIEEHKTLHKLITEQKKLNFEYGHYVQKLRSMNAAPGTLPNDVQAYPYRTRVVFVADCFQDLGSADLVHISPRLFPLSFVALLFSSVVAVLDRRDLASRRCWSLRFLIGSVLLVMDSSLEKRV